jgi:hypothetical protein
MIKQMHYSFKTKINKIDSQTYRNLLVPEIDLVLNEALSIFIKGVAEPRVKNALGFETSQRNIEDIRPLVVPGTTCQIVNETVVLPSDYSYYIRGRVKIKTEKCPEIQAYLAIRQHDDIFDQSVFYKSSYLWRIVNGVFNLEGIKLDLQNEIIPTQATIYYIKKHPYMHNAEDYNPGGYVHPTHGTLTGKQDCLLPLIVLDEIVDIAVALATGNIRDSDYNAKLTQIKLNQFL